MLQLGDMDNTSEGEVKSKRVPRKRVRATRETVKKQAVVSTSEPKVVLPKPAKTAETNSTDSSIRKSPTPFAAAKKFKRKGQRQVIIVGLILIIGIGSSAAIGSTDKGMINVNQAINERNQKTANPDGSQTVTVPVQNTSNKPNGGLKGLGVGTVTPEPAPEPIATTTASSSNEEEAGTTDDTDAAQQEVVE